MLPEAQVILLIEVPGDERGIEEGGARRRPDAVERRAGIERVRLRRREERDRDEGASHADHSRQDTLPPRSNVDPSRTGFPGWAHGRYFVGVPRQALRPVWRCPKCGARLVSRNLSHSCGRFTLERLLASSDRAVLSLARKYVAMLRSLGDVQVIPQKTRLVACARVRFAGFEPRKTCFVATFALQRWLKSPRVIKTVDYGPR